MSRIGQRPHIAPFETADRPVVGYSRDYPPGWATGEHAHPRAQLLYATTGVMRVMLPQAAFTIPPGTGLFVPADQPHAVRMDGTVAMRALFLRHDATKGAPPRVTALAVTPLLRELILAACAEPLEWSLAGPAPHIAALAVYEVARAATLPLALPMPADPRLRRVTEALALDPADRRDLPEHARAAGASVRTLARLFERETGMGFQHWRRHARLIEAMAALAQGATLAQAALTAGYASLPAFGAAFRTAFGTSPGTTRTIMRTRTPAARAPDVASAA